MAQSMHDYVVAELQKLRFRDLDEVAEKTKISKWTIQKIRLRQTKDPSSKNIEPLYHYCKRLEPRRRAA